MDLTRFVARRLALALVTVFGVTVVTFAVTIILPGDVATLIVGIEDDPRRVAAIERQLGLDQPLHLQYIDWLSGVITGDMGNSMRFDDPVNGLIARRFPASAFLALSAMTVAVLTAIPLGVFAALGRDSWRDYTASITAFVGISLPSFFWGLVLILILARYTGLFPPAGYVNPTDDPVDAVRHVALPALALGFGLMAHLTRMTRSSLIGELRAGYIDLARTKGLSERSIIYRHAMRNAFLPVLTVLGFQMAFLFGGVVVIEEVFSYPGLGSLAFSALENRDIPLIQGTVLIFAVVFVVSNLVVDVLYAVLDPRVEQGGGA